MPFEQKLCFAVISLAFGIFADLAIRADKSLFGQAFFWLVSVLA